MIVGSTSTSDTGSGTRLGANRLGACTIIGIARRALEEVHLVPEPALAEHVAVVGQQHDHGVVGDAERGQRVDEPRGPLVDVGDVAVVGAPRARRTSCGR